MRIIVDTALNTGAAEYSNLGDVSMLQVAITRLRQLWPSASIEVLTESAENLAIFCPDAKRLSRPGRDLWVGDSAILGGFERFLPRTISATSSCIGRTLRLRCPAVFQALMYVRLGIRDRRNVRPEIDAFLQAMKSADLFVVCGAGGFTDATQEWNFSTLNTVEEAVQRKVPVVMFGQGLGPLTDVHVRRRARRVLPKVSLLSLRGARGDQALAQGFGLSPSQLVTTGDEAVELAYEARAGQPGEAVGINLRVASYSNVDQGMADMVRPVLQDFARRHEVPLLPIPIAFHAWAKDHLTIQRLLRGFDDSSDGGITLETPMQVIQQAGRCRFVVAGAYHAAVFALSQGIPVIGLSASDDYTAKFLGLKDQFGPGCELVELDKPKACERLTSAMNEMWESASTLRPSLLAAAERQIKASRQAYARVKEHLHCRTNGRDEKSARLGHPAFTSGI